MRSVSRHFSEIRKNKGIQDRGKSVYKGRVACDNKGNRHEAGPTHRAHDEVPVMCRGNGRGSLTNAHLWGTESNWVSSKQFAYSYNLR